MSTLLRRLKRLTTHPLCLNLSALAIVIGIMLLYRHHMLTTKRNQQQCDNCLLRNELNITMAKANELMILSPLTWRKRKNFLLARNLEEKYVEYSIRRMGLKPLDHITPLDPHLGHVVNDVTHFRYPLDVDDNLLKQTCEKWTKDPAINSTLLVVVISAVAHFKQRQIIRQTWARQNAEIVTANWVQVIFLVGLSSKKNETQRLTNESLLHGDLVQVNVIDTYSNLTSKSVALLHCTRTHCHNVDWILKCDDDLYVNFNFLRETLLKLPNRADQLYGAGVIRDSPKRSKCNF